jgi:hypothetical protein
MAGQQANAVAEAAHEPVQRRLVAEEGGDGGVAGRMPDAQGQADMGLGVQVEHDGIAFQQGQGSGDVEGGGGLADTTLLIEYRDDCHVRGLIPR